MKRSSLHVRANIARSSEPSRAGALQRQRQSQHQRHETPGRKPASIVTAVDARLATIAATRSHLSAPTMDGRSAPIGGGR